MDHRAVPYRLLGFREHSHVYRASDAKIAVWKNQNAKLGTPKNFRQYPKIVIELLYSLTPP